MEGHHSKLMMYKQLTLKMVNVSSLYYCHGEIALKVKSTVILKSSTVVLINYLCNLMNAIPKEMLLLKSFT